MEIVCNPNEAIETTYSRSSLRSSSSSDQSCSDDSNYFIHIKNYPVVDALHLGNARLDDCVKFRAFKRGCNVDSTAYKKTQKDVARDIDNMRIYIHKKFDIITISNTAMSLRYIPFAIDYLKYQGILIVRIDHDENINIGDLSYLYLLYRHFDDVKVHHYDSFVCFVAINKNKPIIAVDYGVYYKFTEIPRSHLTNTFVKDTRNPDYQAVIKTILHNCT